MAALERTIIITDRQPCLVQQGTEWVPAFLHIMLSNQQMAKVCTEDGYFRDVWWSRVRMCGIADEMDEYYFGEDE